MVRLKEFLSRNSDLGISIVGKQQTPGGQWILFLARDAEAVFPYRFRMYPLCSDDPDDPEIEPEVAEAVRRRFRK